MKRTVLFLTLLLFWLLGFCTFFASWTQRQMTAQVILTAPEDGKTDPAIPLDSLAWDETGMHLYRPQRDLEGEGPTTVYEESPENYTPGTEELQVQFYGDYIRYSSKPLRVEDPVQIQTGQQTRPDTWLAVFPQGVPTVEPSSGISVAGQSDTALLLAVEKAPVPYMESQAKSQAPGEPGPEALPGERPGRYYSLGDVAGFLTQLPLLALTAGALLAVLVLWGYSLAAARRPQKNRWTLLLNGVLALLLLAAVPVILHFTELPSSLLPQVRITEFAHYGEEFRQVFSSLAEFPENETAQQVLRQGRTAPLAALGAILGGLALGGVTALMESRLGRTRYRKKHEKTR